MFAKPTQRPASSDNNLHTPHNMQFETDRDTAAYIHTVYMILCGVWISTRSHLCAHKFLTRIHQNEWDTRASTSSRYSCKFNVNCNDCSERYWINLKMYLIRRIKNKDKFVFVRAMKSYGRSGCMAPFILHLSIIWRCPSSFTSLFALLTGKKSSVLCSKRLR